ncbi:UNVERIFIED_CONTAM: hypothetical protein GTU68_036767 [Idotea baltica]|nr:hypothetical protein [Idotea baltica]
MNIKIYKVGGAVRDRLLGREVTEIDWVVVGASVSYMIQSGYRPVGTDFPVFIHPKSGEEYALARTERKNGHGYQGFTFHTTPNITLKQDLIRRDLTINAIAEDSQGNLIDPYNGLSDLKNKKLRHISSSFTEDPLRVLRVARFAARYAPLGFNVAKETMDLMLELSSSGELNYLTAERCWKEISKALMEPRPDVFIQVLQQCGALETLLPHINKKISQTITNKAQSLLCALQYSAQQQCSLAERWSCLLLHMNQTTKETDTNRYKTTKECQKIASLCIEYWDSFLHAKTLSPQNLLDLLQQFDIYRRPLQFNQFLQVCSLRLLGCDAKTICHQAFFLKQAQQQVIAITSAPLVFQGLTGSDISVALRNQRLEILSAWMNALN